MEIEDIVQIKYKIADNELEDYKKFVKNIINVDNEKDYQDKFRLLRREYHISPSISNIRYIYNKYYNEIELNKFLEKKFIKKLTRSYSGVNVITVMTPPEWIENGNIKRFSCPYDCHYCPDERDEKGKQIQPRSYISTAPAPLRGLRNNFDIILQTKDRMNSYFANGHVNDKIEFIFIGGTWDSYPFKAQEKFVNEAFYSVNSINENREMKSLEEEIIINQTSKHRIIGITIETRPDVIVKNWKKVILQYRKLGITRVQIGIQHTDNNILEKLNRQSTIEDAIKAIYLLKQFGFKVVAHWMPDLPFSNVEKDRKMFMKITKEDNLQVDDWKIYPTAVLDHTEIKKWYQDGIYKPYAEDNIESLIEMLSNIKQYVPKWIRIERLIRDFPSKSIIAGYQGKTHLRQVIHDRMKENNTYCKCIRCMEVKDRTELLSKSYYSVITFDNNKEYFITKESCSCNICFSYYKYLILWFLNLLIGKKYYFSGCKNYNCLFGFLRLRLDKNIGLDLIKGIQHSAIIRELHVYGNLINNKNQQAIQHLGIGTNLMKIAEEIAFNKGYKKISVISGVGVREYYRKKHNYQLIDTYMVKNLNNINKYQIIYLIYIVIIGSILEYIINW